MAPRRLVPSPLLPREPKHDNPDAFLRDLTTRTAQFLDDVVDPAVPAAAAFDEVDICVHEFDAKHGGMPPGLSSLGTCSVCHLPVTPEEYGQQLLSTLRVTAAKQGLRMRASTWLPFHLPKE